jgi:serine phosphatase RsbU (regulator of sigma subunit)
MTTDGLIHQIGQDKKLPFGIKRFMQFIEQNRTQDLKTQGISLEKEFNEFKGDSFQRDDVTVLGFRITSSSS